MITKTTHLLGIGIATSLVLIFSACSPKPEVKPQAQAIVGLNPGTDFQLVSGQPDADDYARFLAGRPVKHGAELSQFQVGSDNYHTHALEFDFLWRRRSARRIKSQLEYYDNVTRPWIGSPSTVLYPFGGPDILHANAMFPTASTYLMIGLEEVGGIPDTGNPMPLLNNLRVVLEEPLVHGYYITKQMRVAPPAAAIMLTTLSLSGNEITAVTNTAIANRPAIEIRYRTPAGNNKRAIYMKADLSNRGFTADLQNYLSHYRNGVTYFKAASYLMHDNSFSAARNWFVANSNIIFQDDSGIPFRYFSLETRQITLLGSYRRPMELFAKFQQNDLVAAYQQIGGSGPEIPFGSGYHIRPSDANIQIFRKR